MRLSSGLVVACASGAFAHNFKRFANTTIPATPTGTPTGSSAASTSTAAGNPSTVAGFTEYGCVGSSDGFPTFELAETNALMDLELCATACAGSAYFGVFDTECYCGSEISASSSKVATDLCDIECPGDKTNFCGGTLPLARLMARQAVPAGRLLTVYAAEAGATTTGTEAASETVTESVTETVTDEATLTTTFATTVTGASSTTTETVTAIEVCKNGLCYSQPSNRPVFIFIEVNGSDCSGEWVYIVESCSCHGGKQYVPKFCSGDSCAGLVVYKTQECHDWWNHDVYYVAADCEVCAHDQIMYKPWEKTWGTPNNCDVEVVPVCSCDQCPGVKITGHGYTWGGNNGTYTNSTSGGSGSKPSPLCPGPNCPKVKPNGGNGGSGSKGGEACNGADCPKPTGVPTVSGAGKQAIGAATIFAALFAALL
ncbi:hypothetical protein FBEOM_10281 [Fusarium beomiforme]|uniref:WSC domain-containing protein n=1 Tax=Fusarium beomiforme TaxID=44412 RepID=A0A9P5ABT7_9HYPO|nr:hypothetical protein FBEOM_10281 [Fusarium beomiforme]